METQITVLSGVLRALRPEITGNRNRSLSSDIAFTRIFKGESRSKSVLPSPLFLSFSLSPFSAIEFQVCAVGLVRSRTRIRRALYNEGPHVLLAEEESA